MEIQGKVGPQTNADGTTADPRLLKDGSLGASDVNAHFYEANYRGLIFSASNLPAGVAPGTALGTTPTFALYNPPSSGVNLVLLKATLGYVSGTLGAGSIVYAQNPQITKPSSGTALVPISNQLGNGATPRAQTFNGSTLQATPTIVRPAFILGAFAGGAGEPAPALEDLLDGEFLLMPGNAVSLQGVAGAGTTPLVMFSMTWAEVPV